MKINDAWILFNNKRAGEAYLKGTYKKDLIKEDGSYNKELIAELNEYNLDDYLVFIDINMAVRERNEINKVYESEGRNANSYSPVKVVQRNVRLRVAI